MSHRDAAAVGGAVTAFAIDSGTPNGDDSFQAIAERGIPGYRVVRLRPPGLGGHPTPALTSAAYADHYRERIDESGGQPRALLGFCAGGILAYELAARLRAQGEPVATVVLFDTVATTPEHVVNEFVRDLRDIGWSGQTTFGVDVLTAREVALPLLAHDLDNGVAFLEQVTTEFISAFLAARGIGADALAHLTEVMLTRYASCLRYVAASTVRAGLPVDAPMHVAASRSLATAAEEFWSAPAAHVHVIDCDHRELLRSEATYQYLLGCLSSEDTTKA